MYQAKITSKGQITIPLEVRKRLGLREGGKIVFKEGDDCFYIRKIIESDPFEQWIGFLKEKEGESPDRIIEELRGE